MLAQPEWTKAIQFSQPFSSSCSRSVKVNTFDFLSKDPGSIPGGSTTFV